MTISKLIYRLQEIERKHGDMETVFAGFGIKDPLFLITIYKESEELRIVPQIQPQNEKEEA